MVDGTEHHLAAPVAGVGGEAVARVLSEAHGGFAQAEASLLPQVVQADAAVLHPPRDGVGQGQVVADEQALRLREFSLCCVLNVLSHFLFL